MRKKQTSRKDIWQVQDARAQFNALVKAAQRNPQIITVNGRPRMVALSYGHFWAVLTHYFTGMNIEDSLAQSGHPPNRVIRQAIEDANALLSHMRL